MAGYESLLPGRNFRKYIGPQITRLLFELPDLGAYVHVLAVNKTLQFLDLAFKLGNRFFEIQIIIHFSSVSQTSCLKFLLVQR